MPSYNDMGFVDPQGRFHSTEGLSHPDWAHENRALVGFVGSKDIDFNPTDDPDEAVFNSEESTALDTFKWAGWIRVQPDRGIEVSGVYEDNLPLIKAILRSIAKDNPGQELYVDDGEGSAQRVSVSMTGRPDFRSLEHYAKTHRYR